MAGLSVPMPAAQAPAVAVLDALEVAVVQRYAQLRCSEYQRIVASAEALEVAVERFLAAPDASGFAGLKTAWIQARRAYSPSECHRFYGGPIDEPVANLENRINPWPIDESYIDYVQGDPASGIINHPGRYPTLTVDALCALNLKGGERNVATGFHALEFLLWGQGREARGPGIRTWTDYRDGTPGAARRCAYLRAASRLLLADLRQVSAQWAAATPGTFRERLVGGDPHLALQDLFTGMTSLCGDEMACERMAVAYETRSMEDGQSCFSCTSLDDLIDDQSGIESTYLGRGSDGPGPSPSALVAAYDADLDRRVRAQMTSSLAALRAIPGPFGTAIQGPDQGPGRTAIRTAISDLESERRLLVTAAARLGIILAPGVDRDSASPSPVRGNGQADD